MGELKLSAKSVAVTAERLSIVIPNYNYGRYIGEAISSALQIEWHDIEVIVVDDGSTDESIAVVQSFRDRVTLLRQLHAGPREACNLGYEHSTGGFVMFLDSDDAVEPTIMREVRPLFTRNVSKVQVQMRRVGSRSEDLGETFPRYRHSPKPWRLRGWFEATGEYPTPPGSGNIYARWFLDELFPLDDSCGDAADSACLAAAPILGDVETVPLPLVQYRVHGRNRSSLKDTSRFADQVERAIQRQRYACALRNESFRPNVLRRSRHLLQLRVGAYVHSPARPGFPDDTKGRLVLDALVSPVFPGDDGLGKRTIIALWCAVTSTVPRPLAKRLVARRF